MGNLGHLTWRELSSMFLSPLAYVVIALFLAWNGFWFHFFLSLTSGEVTDTYSAVLGGSFLFWIIAIVVPAAITFARISAEKKSGVLEMTMTAPVSDVAYVLSKFFAPAAFWVLLWAPTALYAWLVAEFGATPELGRVLAQYVAVFLVGFVFIAVDLLISAMTASSIVALLMGFFANFALVLIPIGIGQVLKGPGVEKVANYISLPQQLGIFARGIVDSRALVFYLSTIVLALFLAVRTVEVRKWR